MRAKEPVRHCLRDEVKEVRPDARPQARKSRRCIRWNTGRILRGENDVDRCGSFAVVKRSMSNRLLGSEIYTEGRGLVAGFLRRVIEANKSMLRSDT